MKKLKYIKDLQKRNIENVQKSILLLFIMILLILTFITVKHVDVIELSDVNLYPLYYFLIQPISERILIPLIVLMVMFSSKPSYRLLAVLSLAFIIEFLPSYILTNPWIPDQYPFLSEAYWVYLYGNISNVHYLSLTPGLGLTYGIFEIATNMNPFILSKVFSLIQAVALVILLAPLSREIIGNESLLPLLFLSFNYFYQINIFHRVGLFFTLTLAFLYIIFAMVLKRNYNWRLFLISAILFSAMVLAFPASGYILAIIIGTYMTLRFIKKEEFSAQFRLLAIIFLTIYIAWYSYIDFIELRYATGNFWQDIINVIQLKLTFEESATSPFSTGLTPLFKLIVYIRLILDGGVIFAGLFIAMYKFITLMIKDKAEKLPIFPYVLTLMSVILPTPFFLTEWAQWAFYNFSAYILLFSLISILLYLNVQNSQKKIEKSLFMKIILKILAIFIIIIILLVPLLRYTSIPYLNVSTPELSSVFFVYEYYTFNHPCYYFEYPPYTLVGLLVQKETIHELTGTYWFENITSPGLYMITNRALTREGFYIYPQPLAIRIKAIENYLLLHGDKIYDDGYNRAYYLG
jgi:hypothetical protein